MTLSTATPKKKLDMNFENFIVGECNKECFSAAMDVAQRAECHYNSLFIYGECGLGKTHLLQAIKAEILNLKNARINYTTTGKYQTQFVQGLMNGNSIENRAINSQCDVWLFDSFDDIEGKTQLSKEFLNTYDDTCSQGGMVVVAGMQSPDKIKDLDKRIISRFQGGLMLELSFPDFNTKVKIIDYLGQQLGLVLAEDIIELIASKRMISPRQIQGILLRLNSSFKNTNKDVSWLNELHFGN